MRYYARKGIILTDVAGEHILVSARHLRDEVPYITVLNDTSAFCWQFLVDGTDEDELCVQLQKEFEIDDVELLRSDIGTLLAQLKEKNYIREE